MTPCAITADGTRTAPTRIASVFTIARISHLTIDSPSPWLNADLESSDRIKAAARAGFSFNPDVWMCIFATRYAMVCLQSTHNFHKLSALGTSQSKKLNRV
jgi:hypothetical protein